MPDYSPVPKFYPGLIVRYLGDLWIVDASGPTKLRLAESLTAMNIIINKEAASSVVALLRRKPTPRPKESSSDF